IEDEDLVEPAHEGIANAEKAVGAAGDAALDALAAELVPAPGLVLRLEQALDFRLLLGQVQLPIAARKLGLESQRLFKYGINEIGYVASHVDWISANGNALEKCACPARRLTPL